MKPEEFFRAVCKMRREQKNEAVRRMKDKAPELQLETEHERIVDQEIERVEKLYDARGLARFWEE